MRSERYYGATRFLFMVSSSEYRRFEEECRRLAQDAKTEHHRKILEEMAEAWRKLAEEDEE
jgi:hypothetical protein